MKEEDEAKAKKRAEQKRLSEIAADRYLQMMSSTVPDIGFFGSIFLDTIFFKPHQTSVSVYPHQ